MSYLTGISDYPDSRYYDGDLGWLIKQYQKLIKDYDDLNAKYQELINLKDDLDAAIASIDPKINAAITSALADVDKKFSQLTQQMEQYQQQTTAYINQELAKIPGQISEVTDPIVADMQSLMAQMAALQKSMTDFQYTVNASLSSMQQQIDGMEDDLKQYFTAYIDNAIAEWEKELPLVTDPTTGESTQVGSALANMHTDYINRDDKIISRVAATIASSVSDLKGYTDTMVIFQNPATGTRTPVLEFIQWAAEQMKDAYTASELEAMGITVAQMDITQMPAFTYDWTHWATNYDFALIASEFDAGNITATEMDNATVTALEYQASRKWFDRIIRERG